VPAAQLEATAMKHHNHLRKRRGGAIYAAHRPTDLPTESVCALSVGSNGGCILEASAGEAAIILPLASVS